MNKKVDELKKKIEELEQEIKSVKDEGKSKKKRNKKKIVPLETLYSWESMARPYVKRGRAWFLSIATVALILILFFAFLQDIMVILVICVAVFIVYLLGSVPPGKVKHSITNKGIKTVGRLFKWEELQNFWLAEKFGSQIVYAETASRFPSRVVMLVDKEQELKVVSLIADHLEYKEYEEKQGWISKKSDGIMQKPSKYVDLLSEEEDKKNKKKKKSKKK